MAKSYQEMGLWVPPSIMKLSELQFDSPPANISEALERVKKPVQLLQTAVHTEFSGVNLRGIRSHDVLTTRRIGQRFSETRYLEGLEVNQNQMGLVVDLPPGDVRFFEPLRMFMNQVGITEDSPLRGGIVLDEYNLDLEESDKHYKVALLKAHEKDQSGVVFTSWGKVALAPEPTPNPSSMGDKIFQTEIEEQAYNSFQQLNENSSTKTMHPYIAAALVNATILVGTAILRSKIQSDIFNQPVS